MNTFRAILLFAFLILASFAMGQKMVVRNMTVSADTIARSAENRYVDLNNNYAGLVRVHLSAKGAEFEGFVMEQHQHDDGTYWVFMAKDSKRLLVRVPGCLPLPIEFRNHGIARIESFVTYDLFISVPQASQAQHDEGMRYMAMTVEPKNSLVFVDGNPQPLDNGEITILLPKGLHNYSVSAPGYHSEEGSFEIDEESQVLKLILTSLKASLKVEGGTKGAKVLIDGLSHDIPWSAEMNPGNYVVESVLDGYKPYRQDISLEEGETRVITLPQLEMITGRLQVDCQPSGAEVFVDGKKIGNAPNTFAQIHVGEHRVDIKKSGYQKLTKIVTVKENEQTKVSGTLAATSLADAYPQAKETFTVKGVSFVMIRVDGGTFMMGGTSEQGEDPKDNERPVHQVTLDTYMLGETEVTQALWTAVMGDNPSKQQDNPNCPVSEVSWDDCQRFIKRLNALTGKTFRLPTEAEWEFAARGGNLSKGYKYSGGDDVDEVAWTFSNASLGKDYAYLIQPVKTRKGNELGLYDMSGNVSEWCEDWYRGSYYKSSPAENPKGPDNGTQRVVRGGYIRADLVRVSARDYHSPDRLLGSNCFGLRIAM